MISSEFLKGDYMLMLYEMDRNLTEKSILKLVVAFTKLRRSVLEFFHS